MLMLSDFSMNCSSLRIPVNSINNVHQNSSAYYSVYDR